MDGFLRVDSGQNLPSTSSGFTSDNADSTSICPLITPSPPTNALVDSVPDERTGPNFTIGAELAEKLHNVQGDAESISSTSSAAEPTCSQLLDPRANYTATSQTDEEAPAAAEGTIGKTTPIQLTFRNPVDDYFFMSWNWPLIRKISFYFYLSGLFGMLALVIGMIATLPRTCNPPTQWYQGNLFYEIFPASFYSSSKGMEGDLKGILIKSDHFVKLGVRGVRLNSIFKTLHYPKDFENATTLMEIDSTLGTLEDFKSLVRILKYKNMSLILDLPVSSFIQKPIVKKETSTGSTENGLIVTESHKPPSESLKASDEFEPVEEAMEFWVLHGVEGFYLKGLENHAEHLTTAHLLRRWKKLIGHNRILIVSEEVINLTPKENINIVLNNVDLVDIKLRIEKGAIEISKQLESIQNGTLFSKPGMPWIHWSLGNVNSNRLANVLPFANATLGATIFQMMLPGTPSIFYGDEIGLEEISDPDDERKDIKHLHQLTMMPWKNEHLKVLPWIYGGETTGHFEQIGLISQMSELRNQSPSIYMNAVYKQGINKVNAEIKYSQKDFLVIQRWYPRRKAYIVASNLGDTQISTDLSNILYSGTIIVGPKPDSVSTWISFKEVNLWPGESVIVVLD